MPLLRRNSDTSRLVAKHLRVALSRFIEATVVGITAALVLLVAGGVVSRMAASSFVWYDKVGRSRWPDSLTPERHWPCCTERTSARPTWPDERLGRRAQGSSDYWLLCAGRVRSTDMGARTASARQRWMQARARRWRFGVL